MSTLPLRIGINGRFFPNNWRPALQEIAFARTNGFLALEFLGPEEGLGEAHLGAPPLVVGEALRESGVTPTLEMVVRVDGSGRTALGATPLEVLQANLPAINALRVPYVHWHLAPRIPMSDPEIHVLEGVLVPHLAQAVDLAHAHGFRFSLEPNEPDLQLFSTPGACAAALEAVPNLGLVWDLNHTTPAHLAGFKKLIPRMTSLHVSDTPLPEVNHHLPLGLGTVDFTSYCRELLREGFEGPAILEIGGLPKSGGFGRDTDDALRDSKARLVNALREAMKLEPSPSSP